jgi:tetratricopeptide (TPR) repeat protein
MNTAWVIRHRKLFTPAAVLFVLIGLVIDGAAANRPGAATAPDGKDDKIFSLVTSASESIAQGQYKEAVRAYEEALRLKPDPSDISKSKARRWAQNDFAWLLSTCPDDSVRNGERAIALAKELLAARPRDPAYLDTLAAALAETGKFEEAERTVREAISNVPRRVSKNDPTVVGFYRHLENYMSRRPWREP